MPHSIDPKIEGDFFAAIDFLKEEKLPINYSTVAKQAGHGRRLIALKESPYQRVRDAVTEEIDRRKSSTRTKEKEKKPKPQYSLIIQLRRDKARLLEENRILATRLMDAVNIARRALENAPGASRADIASKLRAFSASRGKSNSNRGKAQQASNGS